jgi:hypothetical protein
MDEAADEAARVTVLVEDVAFELQAPCLPHGVLPQLEPALGEVGRDAARARVGEAPADPLRDKPLQHLRNASLGHVAIPDPEHLLAIGGGRVPEPFEPTLVEHVASRSYKSAWSLALTAGV